MAVQGRERGARGVMAAGRGGNWLGLLRRVAAAGAVGSLMLVGSGSPLRAQDPIAEEAELPASREHAPLVYIDCNQCDFSHTRREITFVNYVRDPGLAQVHVLITEQPTGSGGRTFTLFFQGRQQFAGLDQTLSYTSPATHTGTERRQGLTELLKLGLVPYVSRTPLASRLRLTFTESGPAPAAPQHDPWDSWTFEAYLGGNFNTESTQSAWNARYGLFADRVTESWKLRLRPYFNNNARVFRRNQQEVRVEQRRHGFESYVIKSLGDHVGAGVFADYVTNTFDNLRHGVTLTPAVEYSLYPYGESSRRQLTLSYRVGYQLADYYQETIYQRTEETLLNQALNASLELRQPWGSVAGSFTGSNYLHDNSLYRLTFNGNTSLRLPHGVSLNFGGNYQRINDQLSLPRGDASLEDILLQRRGLATSYRASGHVGLSYRFGSIFSNVVNPRL